MMSQSRYLMALAALGSLSVPALAQMSAQPTRAEVQAQASDALARGTLATGEFGPRMESFTSVKSRAEVHAAAVEALARGEIASGDQGPRAESFAAQKTRAQVTAEAAQALRLGLIASGDLPARQASPGELEPARVAGADGRVTVAR